MAASGRFTSLRTLIREVVATTIGDYSELDAIDAVGETVRPEGLEQGLKDFSKFAFEAAKAVMLLRDNSYFKPGTDVSNKLSAAGRQLRSVGILPHQGIANGDMSYFLQCLDEASVILSGSPESKSSGIIGFIDSLSAHGDETVTEYIYIASDALHKIEEDLAGLMLIADPTTRSVPQ